jgi:hypothetical protein
MYFVYVLRSEATARLYVGHTSNLTQRLGQHNHGIDEEPRAVEADPPGALSDKGGRHAARAILENWSGPRGTQAALAGREVNWIESGFGQNSSLHGKSHDSLRESWGTHNTGLRTVLSGLHNGMLSTNNQKLEQYKALKTKESSGNK